MTDTALETTDIPRDRWGRPMIMQPNGKRIAYRRTTTFVGCLEDTYNLMAWKNRMVAYGMGQRKDLVLAAAATDPGDKKQLNEIADKAVEHAQGSAAATIGTALHALTERVDNGQPLGVIPAEYMADLDAYHEATRHIDWLGIETFRVHDKFQVAGTADRIGRINGRTMIFDIKTGSIDYPHKMAMQLAMYAHSTPYDIGTDTRTIDPEPIDQHYGIIIHLPAGQGRCELHEIDISKGWGAVLLAKKVWDWRNTKGLTRPIDPAAPVKKPATWADVARHTNTVEELRDLWKQVADRGELTDDFRAAAQKRSQELI